MKLRDLRPFRSTHIVFLIRIAGDVEELGSWSLDVFPAIGSKRMQWTPSEIQQRREGFGIQLAIGKSRAFERRTNVDSIGIEWCDSQHPRDRRCDIDQRDPIVDRTAGGHTRAGDDQRHAQRRVVDEDAVTDLAVLTECFAVIGGGNDHRVVSNWRERIDETTGLPVSLGDFFIVTLARAQTPFVGWIAVGCVRLEQMEPKEETGARAALTTRGQPGERFVDHFTSGPLVDCVSIPSRWQAIAVGLESFDQSEASIERIRGDERSGRESGFAQLVCQRRRFQIDPHSVMPRAMTCGVAPGHQARVRRQRDWRGRVRVREQHAVTG